MCGQRLLQANLHIQHGRLARVNRLEATRYRGFYIAGLAHAFAVRAKGLRHLFKVPVLALQTCLKFIGLGGRAIGVDAQHGLFHGLPAAVVQHHGKNRQVVALGGGVHRRWR